MYEKTMSKESSTSYYATTKTPEVVEEHAELAKHFLKTMLECDNSRFKMIALVTSGGTSVPVNPSGDVNLENFSTGRRGSEVAEKLLENNYLVIFLHRKNSLLPFWRYFDSEGNSSILDSFEYYERPVSGDIVLRAKDQTGKELLQKYATFRDRNQLLLLKYTTINEYLFSIRVLIRLLAPYGRNVALILSAAVSDFYITPSCLKEFKPDNTNQKEVTINFSPVPKTIPYLIEEANSQAFVVMFKLVTNSKNLESAVNKLLNLHHVNAVIGNVLNTRYYDVYYFRSPLSSSNSVDTLIHLSTTQREASKEPLSHKLIEVIMNDHYTWASCKT